MSRPVLARFRCGRCAKEWREELPPLWSGFEMWPECCERRAMLVEPCVRRPAYPGMS